jgi:uncharacterized protein involved in exopolysaccharide biosynthesis
MPLTQGSFDGFQYVDYMRGRWRFALVACCVAFGLSLGISLSRSKKYSATVRIMIEPPAGLEARPPGVSQNYWQSLRSFLLFASSDSLFQEAADHFVLRDAKKQQPIGVLKRSILDVDIPRDTNVLEITTTLPDPHMAQAFANYLAGRIVDLNERVIRRDDQELISAAEGELAQARARLNEAESAWSSFVTSEPVDNLKEELAALEQLSAKEREQLASTDLDIAGNEDREKTLSAAARAGELEEVQSELRSARAAAATMRKQMQDLDSSIRGKQLLLNQRTALREKYADERKAAQSLYESIQGRIADARATAGSRGERLRIIDPGIVPDRPSSPNITLNILVTLLAAAVLSLLYLTLEFNYQLRQSASKRAVTLRVSRP